MVNRIGPPALSNSKGDYCVEFSPQRSTGQISNPSAIVDYLMTLFGNFLERPLSKKGFRKNRPGLDLHRRSIFLESAIFRKVWQARPHKSPSLIVKRRFFYYLLERGCVSFLNQSQSDSLGVIPKRVGDDAMSGLTGSSGETFWKTGLPQIVAKFFYAL